MTTECIDYRDDAFECYQRLNSRDCVDSHLPRHVSYAPSSNHLDQCGSGVDRASAKFDSWRAFNKRLRIFVRIELEMHFVIALINRKRPVLARA